MMPLEVEGLGKSFGEVRAVDGVRFHIGEGEIYGLLGPNGAGKTTTISMISGLLRPDMGKVKVMGRDFWQDPPASQKFMGVVPQEMAVYEELSALENLVYWRRLAGVAKQEAKSRAGEVLSILSLEERGRDPVKDYSGGMKRRVNLGCALMHKPKLLLLDELTVGIDPQARTKLLSVIKELAEDGTAILYTTHYLEEAENLCHRMGVIDHGRLLAEGSLDSLRDKVASQSVFILEGQFSDQDPEQWPGFEKHFRLVRKEDSQCVIASTIDRDPGESLREILAYPVAVSNVTYKKPSLNDVFLHLTGRELRE